MTEVSTMSTSDGIDLVLRRWEAPTPRATVLIVHGVSEHAARWDHVGAFLAQRGDDTHGYDLRGHGVSGGAPIDLNDFDEHIDDLAAVAAHIRRTDIPFVIYGHSMGGLVVTGYATSNHPQPDRFVLSAPALSANVPMPLRMAVKVLARVGPGLRLPSTIKGSQLSRLPEVGEAYFADPLVRVRGTARFGQTFLEAMDEITAALERMTVTTLVIHGGDDTIVPPSASAVLARVPAVTRKVFPELRHEMHNEPEFEEVLGFVADWLDAELD